MYLENPGGYNSAKRSLLRLIDHKINCYRVICYVLTLTLEMIHLFEYDHTTSSKGSERTKNKQPPIASCINIY